MKEMRDSLSDQLKWVVEGQQKLQEEVTNLNSQCAMLRRENCTLREDLKNIRSKCDSL